MNSFLSSIDAQTLCLRVQEGAVYFAEDAENFRPDYTNNYEAGDSWAEFWGRLDTELAEKPESWAFRAASSGKAPTIIAIYRKTKITGMAQLPWNEALNDYEYQTPVAHELYIELSEPLEEDKSYTLIAKETMGLEKNCAWEIKFNSFTSQSEALHINLHGFSLLQEELFCDLSFWRGSGGARDYTSFEGRAIWLIAEDGRAEIAGKLERGAGAGQEAGFGNMTGSTNWIADIPSPKKAGSYRIAIKGIGCTAPFEIDEKRWKAPFDTSLRGYYYMRLGEEIREDIVPEPRQPRYIPGVDPKGCKILRTSMHPWHPEWKTFAPGDKWDPPKFWAAYVKPDAEPNMISRGGHSDALDWDRHLGHVSSIYDMLLPYYLLKGSPSDDDCGIAETGNGLPDLLDEAQNEVDFWLSLRDGEGYSHGTTNPDEEGVIYQADATSTAAWANAVNAAMYASCLKIAGRDALCKKYTQAALEAWDVANRAPQEELGRIQNLGLNSMRGQDFKMTAAAFLWDLTGEEAYEQIIEEQAHISRGIAEVSIRDADQIWATAGYLGSSRHPKREQFADRLRKLAIETGRAQAMDMALRPSRRSSDRDLGFFHTGQNVMRIILAHHLVSPSENILRQDLLRALLLEADWGMGRNPLNMIQMTTAYSPLATYRSVENAYTSGRRDGRPGLHPGHTPYMNTHDWGKLIMARPSWIAEKGWPPLKDWPRAEACYNTRWTWAHSEFTPQQTMRGKMALYAYLHGLGL